jgi:hypothetical protein
MVPTPVVRCRACGHEEEEWTSYGPTAVEPEMPNPLEMVRERRNWEEEWDRRRRQAIASVDFPVYAAADRPAGLSGWGGSSGRAVNRITLAHSASSADESPTLRIETARAERRHGGQTERSIARAALADLLSVDAGRPPELSPAARTVWFATRLRERRRLAALAGARRRQFPIDGRPEDFEVAETDGRFWAAVRRHGDLVITISADDVSPAAVRLERVQDLGARLTGAATG